MSTKRLNEEKRPMVEKAQNGINDENDLEFSGGVGSWSRVHVITSFILLALLQAMTWNFWSPISKTALEVYGFTDADVAWLANTANIAMLVFLPAAAIAVDKLGARTPTVLCAGGVLLCTVLRVVPQVFAWSGVNLGHDAALAVNVASMIFNGMSATWLNFAGPALSETWYGAKERAKVTALISVAPYIGVSMGFLIGPVVVPEGRAGKTAMENLLWACVGVAVAVFVAVLVHFPNAPAVAPSRSAARRTSIRSELTVEGDGYSSSKQICGEVCLFQRRSVKSLWIICVTFSLPFGVLSGWMAVLAIVLRDVANVGAKDAGFVGCAMTMLGCVSGMVVAAINDRYPGRMKSMILLLSTLATACFLLFGLQALHYWEVPQALRRPVLFATSIGGGCFLNANLPLFFELAVEETYPEITGSTSTYVLTLGNTFVQSLFLAISFVPGASQDSARWMNWIMMLATPLFTLPLVFMKVLYKRHQDDQATSGRTAARWFDGYGW
eukprot:m.182154 g.182154  ORF g.182154 m.182154 type:complete len:498 (-) comp18456_c0_seq1:135-1628(-)